MVKGAGADHSSKTVAKVGAGADHSSKTVVKGAGVDHSTEQYKTVVKGGRGGSQQLDCDQGGGQGRIQTEKNPVNKSFTETPIQHVITVYRFENN